MADTVRQVDYFYMQVPTKTSLLPFPMGGSGCIFRHRQSRQLRDPGLFEENGRTFLFYAFCGEQGIAAAELSFE